MAPRGKVRKFDPTIPRHIDQAALPKGVYWDRTGRGRWYVFLPAEGPPPAPGERQRMRRETIAGPDAKLSDLHAMIEGRAATGTLRALAEQYHASPKFAKLAATTRADYEYSRDVLLGFPTQAGGKVGDLQADRIRTHHVQRMVDKLESDGHPTKANKLLRYTRLLYTWGLQRGLVRLNPGKGVSAAEERKRQRLPEETVYMALLTFALECAGRKARTEGSIAPYLPIVMELGYLCRLRGIETLTLTEAQADEVGIRTQRRKGSRDNIVRWNPRLRAAWDAATAYRRGIIERTTRITPLRPEDRLVILAEHGEPLTKSGLDSAWQRFIRLAIEKEVITADQRFGLHDLKRKGGTDTPGTFAEKQQALGLTEQMMKVYDKSVPEVAPSA